MCPWMHIHALNCSLPPVAFYNARVLLVILLPLAEFKDESPYASFAQLQAAVEKSKMALQCLCYPPSPNEVAHTNTDGEEWGTLILLYLQSHQLIVSPHHLYCTCCGGQSETIRGHRD